MKLSLKRLDLMLNCQDLRKYVVRPTLEKMGLWSESAEELILGTIAHESRLGTYLHQINGPALGICQIEPTTHQDLWENYLKFRPDKAAMMAGFASRNNSSIQDMTVDDSELITNLGYSIAVCRMIYYRKPEPLPDSKNVAGLATYWKTYYNTHQGRGTIDQFILDYKQRVN